MRETLTSNRTYFVRTPPVSASISIASPAVVSSVGHGLSVGDPVVFNTTGALPTGLTAGEIYYVIAAGFGEDAFGVSAASGGTAVNTSGSQSGAHAIQTGNDSNDGSSATRTGALLTINRATDLIQKLDCGGFRPTIKLAKGVYLGEVDLKPLHGMTGPRRSDEDDELGYAFLSGDTTTPGNCRLTSINKAHTIITYGAMANWLVEGVRIKAIGDSFGVGLGADEYSSIRYRHVEFDICTSHIAASAFSIIQAIGPSKIVGSAVCHALVYFQSTIYLAGTVTLVGTPQFSAAFARVFGSGGIIQSTATYSGPATGRPYVVVQGTITASSPLPGDMAGIEASGGHYNPLQVTPSFSAYLGTDQAAIASAVYTKVKFDTEEWDSGGFFNPSLGRWTPPAGKYEIKATVYFSAGIVDGALFGIVLYKNGAAFKMGAWVSANGAVPVVTNGSWNVQANGTDYFELYTYGGGPGAKTLLGDPAATFFQGNELP